MNPAEIELAARCRAHYREFADVPMLDLFALALGYEIATPADTERRGSVFIQRVFTILAWGVDVDDALIVRLANRSDVAAYLPSGFKQDRFLITRNGKNVLTLASALTQSEISAIEQGRQEIARLKLWQNPDLAPVLKKVRRRI